jgi:hypothetical protein
VEIYANKESTPSGRGFFVCRKAFQGQRPVWLKPFLLSRIPCPA